MTEDTIVDYKIQRSRAILGQFSLVIVTANEQEQHWSYHPSEAAAEAHALEILGTRTSWHRAQVWARARERAQGRALVQARAQARELESVHPKSVHPNTWE